LADVFDRKQLSHFLLCLHKDLQMSQSYALITGASDGIGKELAIVMAEKRHNLILVARRRVLLEELKQELETSFGVSVVVFDADLSDSEQRLALFERCSAYRVEILVNNAGFGSYGNFFELDWSKEENMVKLNVLALMHLTHLFLPSMVKNGKGKILHTASIAAFQPGPKMATYFATKAFVVSFSQAISWELKKTGVSVSALCPGPVLTGFQSAAGVHDANMFKMMVLPTARQVAVFGYRAMMKGKRVAIEGRLNRVLIFISKFIPSSWLLAVSAKAVRVE
jgi:short-subunit dehydrogenase